MKILNKFIKAIKKLKPLCMKNGKGFWYQNALFWIEYDRINSTIRFFSFITIITIPIAIISTFNFPLAMLYGATIILFREKGLHDADKCNMLRYI